LSNCATVPTFCQPLVAALDPGLADVLVSGEQAAIATGKELAKQPNPTQFINSRRFIFAGNQYVIFRLLSLAKVDPVIV
jgi:hypothetical protein